MIAIIDYGMGNIHSVNKALVVCGAKTIVTNKPEDIDSCDKAVLPGVGAFDDAMAELKKRDLVSCLSEFKNNKKPLLGICLGLQLFFEESEEAKKTKGLGLVKGKVKRFEASPGLKVPHMGWNQLKITRPDCPLFEGVEDNSYVYFCHSYYPKPRDARSGAGATDYGIGFDALIWQDNIYGAQFHPEKSQVAGLAILKNFVKL